MVFTLRDDDICHHSGQMWRTPGVQASESGVNFDHCDDECCC